MSDLSANLREQVLEIAQALVRVESLSGDEQRVIDLVGGFMHRLGYEDVRVDECGNIIGKLTNHKLGPVVLYDAHVDTVAAADADQWTYPPFSGEITEDRIYGRGTSDMKGALAAALVGLAAAKDDNKLEGTVFVSASVGEEVIEGLTMAPIIKHYSPDLVVICESTGLKLATAQRGRAELEIVVHGKSAHASNPQIGVNAFRHMAHLAAELDKLQAPFEPQLGLGILEPTSVITSPFPNVSVVPWRCTARYDRRTLVGETPDDVLAPINAVIERIAAENLQFKAEARVLPGTFTCYTGLTMEQETFAPAWRMADDHPLVVGAREALGGVELSHYSFCTNGSYTLGRAKVPTIGFGPGFEYTAHITDEYLDLEQLFGAVEGYYALAGIGDVG